MESGIKADGSTKYWRWRYLVKASNEKERRIQTLLDTMKGNGIAEFDVLQFLVRKLVGTEGHTVMQCRIAFRDNELVDWTVNEQNKHIDFKPMKGKA